MTERKTFEAYFDLSKEERVRLEAAPFNAPPEALNEFAGKVADQLLNAYGDGEIDFRRMIAVTRSCSLGCIFKHQVMLLAYVAVEGLRITPKTLNRKRPPHPKWVQRSAGHLIEMLRQASDEPVAPSVYSSSSKILENATAWLIAAGLYEGAEPVGSRQLYDWYLETMQADGHDLKVGRPRKKTRPNSKTGEI